MAKATGHAEISSTIRIYVGGKPRSSAGMKRRSFASASSHFIGLDRSIAGCTVGRKLHILALYFDTHKLEFPAAQLLGSAVDFPAAVAAHRAHALTGALPGIAQKSYQFLNLFNLLLVF